MLGTDPPLDADVNQYSEKELTTPTTRGAALLMVNPLLEYTYDDNGNMTLIELDSTAVGTLTYDYRNQMTQLVDATTTSTYRYDALGRRVSKTVGTDETYFFYGGQAAWQVLEETDGNEATEATYVYGVYIDEPIQMERGADVLFYHQDDLYNVWFITDEMGAVVESYDYVDFGHPVAPSAEGNPYLWNGRRYDAESKFYYYRTRYLSWTTGRFTTRDMIGIWGDPTNLGNGYSFVGNNPWSMIDPYGLAGWLKWWNPRKWDDAIDAPIHACAAAAIEFLDDHRIPILTTVWGFNIGFTEDVLTTTTDFLRLGEASGEAVFGTDIKTGEEMPWRERGLGIGGDVLDAAGIILGGGIATGGSVERSMMGLTR